jgi:hypothetical protein
MVAINKILLPERNGEGCGGGTRNRSMRAHLSTFYSHLSAGAGDPPSLVSHEATKNAKTIK